MQSTPRSRPTPERTRSRGQVLVIFAGALFLLMMMAAIVVDISWYWVNTLRVQRAADAAALAGAVWLPAQVGQAKTIALEEATKDGYTNGPVSGLTGKVVVDPQQDGNEPRRLNVTITAPIGTFFMRVIGIPQMTVTRSSKAEFTLPIPMGSPEAFYGTGFYEGRVAHNDPVPGTTGWQSPSQSGTGTWVNPDAAQTSNNPTRYATADTNGQAQQWQNFNPFNGISNAILSDPTFRIAGLEVRMNNVSLTGSGASTNCLVKVETNWNGGNNANWSSAVQSNPITTTATDDSAVGSQGDTTAWGAHNWVLNDFSSGNFRVRLTWQDGNTNCGTARAIQLDELQVKVQYETVKTTYTNQTLTFPKPAGGPTVPIQNFWGAMFTPGGWRENGDRYGPSFIGNGTGAPSGNPNPDYTGKGYDYLVEVGASGEVQLFDPEFCATGDNGHGGSFGAGDHWTSPTGDPFDGGPVSITYRLYDTKGTTANPDDDGNPIAFKRYDPGNSTLGDFSGAFGTPSNQGTKNAKDCANDAAHNKWVSLASGLGAGTYRLNVNTSVDENGNNDASNFDTGAENMFSVYVGGGTVPRVYGAGKMAAYTNLDTGSQQFYFMQIGKQYAGKTIEILLFDPGECSEGDASVGFLSPDGNKYGNATFDWTADNGKSGTGATTIQTCSGGNALFNNHLITIEIDLKKTYGATGLNPPGPPAGEAGWWKVDYNIKAANDTTTWQVSIKGNPVHLIVP